MQLKPLAKEIALLGYRINVTARAVDTEKGQERGFEALGNITVFTPPSPSTAKISLMLDAKMQL